MGYWQTASLVETRHREGGETNGVRKPSDTGFRYSAACSTRSSALYMYLTFLWRMGRLGSDLRFTFNAPRSYHSIVPSISSPSSNTITMGVCASICFL